MSLPTTIGGVALAFAGYPVARRLGGRFGVPAVLPDDETVREDLLKWLVTGALLAYVLVVETEPLGSLGATLPPPILPGSGVGGLLALLGWWAGGVVGTVVLSTVAYNLFRHVDWDTSEEFTDEQADRPTALFLFTGITAGITESVLYQAYPIERLAALSGSVALAGVASWLAFTAVHYATDRFSLQATVFTSVPALAVTALYVLSGSVYVVVLVHATVNALSFLSQ
ncbi:CPBP family glutamic-type intramembrane protease [Halolamina sp. C58]|uniref:CPBP family glutamic-type intramembrane protease n=1 Tax=Halolamina sp. C58 TaxID=3421640 RepID=UPI003EBC852D